MAKYLTEMERCKIETMLKDGLTQREIAKRLGRHYNTINYEIKKGRVEFLNTDLTTREVYCYDVGQRIHEERCTEKGRPLKIGNDMAYVRYVEDKIINDRYSPYAVTVSARGKFKTDVCVTTLYSYIDKGIFLNITNKNLAYKERRKRKYNVVRRASNKNLGAKYIEERPKIADTRTEYGHWELDTVVGKRNKGDGCLMVLTERMTREEIILKLKAKDAKSVISAFDMLEHAFGSQAFRDTFKTITPDNGCEFSDVSGIEKDGRTRVYFAHPSCPHERGSNENQNKMIRRWIPKGRSMKDLKPEEVLYIQEWLNNYTRRLFNGLSAMQYKNIAT